MPYKSARYLDETRATILAVRETGVCECIPADPANRAFRELREAGVAITAPSGPSLENVKEKATARVIAFADEVGAQLTAGYPRAEVQSWPAKAAEAKAWLADTTRAAPAIIDAEARATGNTPEQVARAVVAKAAFFERVAGFISGLRQKTEAAIEAATDAAGVEAALQAGLAEAQAEMRKLRITP